MFTPFAFVREVAAPGPPPPPFIMVVKSDNSGTSSSTQFTLTGAGVSSGTTFDVNFSPIADPTDITSVTLDVSSPTITFPVAGNYIVRVDPTTFNKIVFNNSGDKLKLLTITQWGSVAWSSMSGAFRGCSNMDVTATDYPDLSLVTVVTNMFFGCSVLVGTSDFNDWDTSAVTNMAGMFNTATLFNQDIGGWNVSNVTNMGGTFANATAFNQDIGGWDTSAVTNMSSMFQSAPAFNQDISGWNVSNVTSFSSMFRGATAFNQDIGGWDTSAATQMISMFESATAFNQDIGGWDVSNVSIIAQIFRGATAFNQDISGWNVSNVTSFSSMFRGATAFNQDISGWNVSKVGSFASMFREATAFNQNLGSWAFKTTGSSLPSLGFTFADSGMSCANYTDTIVGWANYVNTNDAPKSRSMTSQTGRVFANDRSGGAAFADSEEARTYLTGVLPDGGWTISGDTVQASC